MNTHLNDILAREFYTSSVVIINKAHSSKTSEIKIMKKLKVKMSVMICTTHFFSKLLLL